MPAFISLPLSLDSFYPPPYLETRRYRPQLFYGGRVYVAVPPLYKVERGKSLWWAHTEEELRHVVSENRLPAGSYSVQRFKGLGEMMPQQLWDTTLNPETR